MFCVLFFFFLIYNCLSILLAIHLVMQEHQYASNITNVFATLLDA